MNALSSHLGEQLAGHSVRRFERSRHGALLAELEAQGQPRWLEVGEHGLRPVEPELDPDLPIAARLDELRRLHNAEVLAYRPGRRIVLRVRRAGAPRGGAVLKAGRRGRLNGMLDRHGVGTAAARSAGLEAADVLAVEPPSAMYAMRDLGRERVVIETSAAARFQDLGRCLRRFQEHAPQSELGQHSQADELDLLANLAAKTRELGARVPEAWEGALAELSAWSAELPRVVPVLTHRDLHDKQLLACGLRTALLDFDQLCLADAAMDVANLLVHLELRALQGSAPADGARACAAAFLAGYEGGGTSEWALRMDFYAAATHLRLALVYAARPPWSHLGTTLVERARAQLERNRRGIA